MSRRWHVSCSGVFKRRHRRGCVCVSVSVLKAMWRRDYGCCPRLCRQKIAPDASGSGGGDQRGDRIGAPYNKRVLPDIRADRDAPDAVPDVEDGGSGSAVDGRTQRAGHMEGKQI